MAKVSKYPTREVSEINRFFRLFGTDDNDSKSPQVNIPVEVLLKYVLDNFSNDGDMVSYLPQTKEEFEKAIARINIGATSSDEVLNIINDHVPEIIELLGYEKLINKQNDLNPDGTGTKYPTVDAVNEVIQQVRQEIGEVGGDKNFVYDQPTPSSVWVIRHGLGKKVNVTIVDSANTVVIGQVTINDGNMVRIEFNASFTGQAILN